jgi:hypothetical protein
VRFVPALARSGTTIVLEAQPELVLLLQLAGLAQFVIPRGIMPTRYDFHLPLLSAPAVLGLRADAIPAEVPYLKAEPERVAAWRARLGEHGFKIGIVWQGRPDTKDDCRGRSVVPVR